MTTNKGSCCSVTTGCGNKQQVCHIYLKDDDISVNLQKIICRLKLSVTRDLCDAVASLGINKIQLVVEMT